MPEDFGQSKTEAPTQRRREEARQKGQVALSAELTHGLVLLAGCIALWLGGEALGAGLLRNTRTQLESLRRDDPSPALVQNFLTSFITNGAEMAAWFLVVTFVVGLAVGGLQAGFHISPESVQIQWSRVSPGRGWSRLFSGNTAMRGFAALLKTIIVTWVAYWVLRERIGEVALLGEGNLAGAAGKAWEIALHVALAVAAALVLIGMADYTYQRWWHEQQLRMSRQDLKEELRREEGDPLMRARIRKLQREQAQRRMIEDVPKAAVVITNPTHLAIALQYERGKSAAPKVVAKGAGEIARRIVEVARRHAVPVLERKPLAQSLFKVVAVGQEIPAALYYAVAEVMAYVYRLRSVA